MNTSQEPTNSRLRHKPAVQRIMDLARQFRSSPGGELYDQSYKAVEQAAYESLEAVAAPVSVEVIRERYWCNKCGTESETSLHKRSDGNDCHYAGVAFGGAEVPSDVADEAISAIYRSLGRGRSTEAQWLAHFYLSAKHRKERDKLFPEEQKQSS